MMQSLKYLEGLSSLDLVILAMRDKTKLCGIKSTGDDDEKDYTYIYAPAFLHDDMTIEVIDTDTVFDIHNDHIACMSPASIYIKDDYVKSCSDMFDYDDFEEDY